MSKLDWSNVDFETMIIHAGQGHDPAHGALATPIYQTSTFCFETVEEGADKFAKKIPGYQYTRGGNPTTRAFELKCAAMEGGEDAVATASGMGAVGSVMIAFLKCGDHVIFDNSVYGGTNAVATVNLPNMGIEVSRVDTSDLEALKAHLKPNTCAVYLETPANPNLKITDIAAVAELAHAYNKDIMVVCDNTFASPALQNPLVLGADVVVHSATKYLNGHGDVIAGFVVGKKSFISEVRMFGLKDMTGAVMDPFCAFLILRGLKTLEIRMARHCENASQVAAFLDAHPAVEKVYYPGLESHERHEVAARQMADFGGMLSFEVKGGRPAGVKLVNSLHLVTVAVSLGDAETLIEHPASMTHSTYTEEELASSGIAAGLIRLSVGLENVEDIIADLKQALDQL